MAIHDGGIFKILSIVFLAAGVVIGAVVWFVAESLTAGLIVLGSFAVVAGIVRILAFHFDNQAMTANLLANLDKNLANLSNAIQNQP